MKQLFIEDLDGMTNDQVQNHVMSEYEASPYDVLKYDILIAYESVGSWGCDSASFFLLKDRSDGKLYEVNGSHCSCYGFEGQWSPEETTVDYLKSDKFRFYIGGYDGDPEINRQKMLDYIANEL